MRTVSILDLNLSTADAATPDGIVHFGRFYDIGGDAETEAVIMNDGDESLSLNYNNVELLEPMYVGDMMQFRSYITHVGNTSRDFVIEGYKVATPAFRAGVPDAGPSDRAGEIPAWDSAFFPPGCSPHTDRSSFP